jgi:amino acid adenylation domain-containing protein
VLKAGGCYLPVDPRGPRARRESILRQAGVRTVVSAGDLSDEVWAPGRRVLDLDLERAGIEALDSRDLGVGLAAENLAYALFTSGTTGQPKGVMITHGGFLNRMLWAQRSFPLTAADRVLRKAACTFDVSLDELFRALLNGSASVLMPETRGFDPGGIAEVIERYGVTDADFTPTVLRELLAAVDPARLRSLRKIVSGVEALSADTERLVLESLGVALFNLYGPTEVSVSATSWRCDGAGGRAGVPIGRPMDNVRCYVLDEALRPAPPGQVGELFIGGAGLARGYLADPAMTARRFIPDMLSGVPGGRLYRTGDLARQGHDGVLEFLGRADAQIKHLGYRIEPAEVAAAIREFPGVAEAVVVSDGAGGDARLVAHLVSDGPVRARELRAFLRDRLPDYMVPAAYARIDAVPLTAHGKLDAAALPPVPREAAASEAGFSPPRDEIEAKLADIWRQILLVDRVGIHDSFFDLGGESMQAARIVASARGMLGADVGVAAIFDAPTIAELAAYFRSSGEQVSDTEEG